MAESGFAKSNEAEQHLLPPQRPSRALWPWGLLLVALLVGLALRASIQRPREDRGEQHPAVGTRIDLLRLEPLTGEATSVSETDLIGKVTLINFWGPWCGVCAVEFPHLVEIEKHFRAEPHFRFLSVSSNYNPRDEQGLVESTAQFLKQQQADFPTYRDPQAQSTMHLIEASKLEGFGYPTTALIGKQGVVRALWVGYVPGDEKAVQEAIEKALGDQG